MVPGIQQVPRRELLSPPWLSLEEAPRSHWDMSQDSASQVSGSRDLRKMEIRVV